MNLTNIMKTWHKRISFHGLSIQQRLPLLICILLCSFILTFGFASYYGVKKTVLENGKKRLRDITDQLGDMFFQSSAATNNHILTTVQHDTIKKCIYSGGKELRDEVNTILSKLKRDSSWLRVELLDSSRKLLAGSGDEGIRSKLGIEKIFSGMSVEPGSCKTGKTYVARDSMLYPIVASVSDKGRSIGYVVLWVSLSASPEWLKQLSQLIGAGGTMYLGNDDGSLWTNLMKPIPAPPVDTAKLNEFWTYSNYRGEKVIAAMQRINTTRWFVLIEFSEEIVLEAAIRFLRWIFVIGGLLIVAGILLTWSMSRNIIKPLNQLTAAASAIASGDFSAPVKINRMDELGKLVQAFNTMSDKVHVNQLDLEHMVRNRTEQLEAANREMESFTYSVSHDLRAPLRAITRYATMLEEKHRSGLDDEGTRLLSVIKINTLKMGQLIDDLLEFSKLGRNDIVKTNIDTNRMIQEIISSIDARENVTWEIEQLPSTTGDMNTMRQVWVNLISNAVKYSRNEPHPHIEIKAISYPDKISFSIKDNGVGFDQKYANKLFKVFQRLHGPNEFEGTGIGLAIVEKIISKHSGKVWGEAEKGKGATFFFDIPK